MKRLSIILAVASMAFSWACSTDIIDEPTTGSIAGSVADRTTGEPVATVNVLIEPGGSSTVTGSDGTFSFQNLEAGKYTLTITKDGYKQNGGSVSVRVGDPTPAHLLIERIPAVVTADRDLLDFGSNESTNTLSFNIVNPGYVDLDWEIEERCDWITEVKPAKGTLKYGKTEAIVVVIDRELLASGPNEAVIVVRSSNGSSDVKVTAIGAERYTPTMNTFEATDITASSAILNGEISDVGKPAYTERGFVYSFNTMPAFDNMISKVTAPVTDEAKFSYTLKDLEIGKTYYVRAYASNKVGTAYSSNEISFTTEPTLPVVSTLDILDADIPAGTATFRGSIDSIGEPAYTERGFVYGTMPDPTIYDNKVVASGSAVEGAYSIYMKDLPKTYYYIRAYAINDGGVAYGQMTSVELEWVDLHSLGIGVQKKDAGKADWESAKTMCEKSQIGGYDDWVLPTKEELLLLYSNKEFIGNFKEVNDYLNTAFYWSSTFFEANYSGNYSLYWSVDFANGNLSHSADFAQHNVRCVRALKQE